MHLCHTNMHECVPWTFAIQHCLVWTCSCHFSIFLPQESTLETSRGTSSMRDAIAIWNFWDATWWSMNLSDTSSFTNNRSHYHWQTMSCVYVISFSGVLLRIKNHIKQLWRWQVLQKLHRMNFGWLWPLWHPACASLSTFIGLSNACVWTWRACSVWPMFICLRGATNFECPALTSDLFRSLWFSRTLSCLLYCKKQCLSGTNPFLASNQGVLLSHVTIATGLHGFVQLLLACGPVSSRERCLQLYLVWTWADVNLVWT